MVFYKAYIDPGTGSMLFAVLFSVLGAAMFFLRGLYIKIKFAVSSGKADTISNNKIPLVIFSDDKRYWSVFKPVCREFDSKGVDVVYYTASPDDPCLENTYQHIKAQFIGEGNKAFSKLNFLNAHILISTTPGLEVYQWKKSKNVDCYVHMLHAASDVTAYRMFGIDYYDAALLSGNYQIDDIRELESLRNLPAKDLVLTGIPYMDDMLKRLESSEIKTSDNTTVLLAPSWGDSGILKRFGKQIIDALICTGYHIIIRPHPQSFKSEAEMIESLMNEYPNSDKLEWNHDNDNFDVLNRSDILISDFSGVILDYALVFNKPVIYTDTDFDYSPYDAWWLKRPLWTFTILPEIGKKLTKENIDDVKSLIDSCINSEEFKNGRNNVRKETWANIGNGSQKTVEYLLNKLDEITTAAKP